MKGFSRWGAPLLAVGLALALAVWLGVTRTAGDFPVVAARLRPGEQATLGPARVALESFVVVDALPNGSGGTLAAGPGETFVAVTIRWSVVEAGTDPATLDCRPLLLVADAEYRTRLRVSHLEAAQQTCRAVADAPSPGDQGKQVVWHWQVPAAPVGSPPGPDVAVRLGVDGVGEALVLRP